MAGCAASLRALLFFRAAVAAVASAPASLRVRRLYGLPSTNETVKNSSEIVGVDASKRVFVTCEGVAKVDLETEANPCQIEPLLPRYAEEMDQQVALGFASAGDALSQVVVAGHDWGMFSRYVWSSCLAHVLLLECGLVLFAVWLMLELVFYAWYVAQVHRANVPSPPPRVTAQERDWIWSKVMEHSEHHGLWRQVQGWFLAEDQHSPEEIGRLPCSHEEIGYDNLLELMSWAFCYKRFEDLDEEEREWVLRRTAEGAKALVSEGRAIAPGRTGAFCMRHTLDPVKSLHRPLLFYALVALADAFHGCLLRLQGFRRGRHRGLRYWYRAPLAPCASAAAGGDELPLAFFHGIGFGLLQYMPLVFGLRQRQQFLFEMPWIAMRPLAKVPSSSEYADWVVEAMEAHGVQQFVPFGHSFGSLAVAWLVRRHADRVPRCILVDPVSVFLNLPDVCANFLYRAPWNAFGNLIRLVAAREFGVARCLSRHFWWTECVLFPEMLPPGSSLTLMGEDHILPADVVRSGAAKVPGLRTTVMPSMDHGHFLFSMEALDSILDEIDDVCRCSPKVIEADEDSPRGWRAAEAAWSALGASL